MSQQIGNTNQGKKTSSRAVCLPDDVKGLRACLICKLLKSGAEFEKNGCDNCEGFLHLAGKTNSRSYTTTNYDGFVAMIKPGESWVAKYTRIENLKPGMYAIQVNGEVSEWVQEILKEAGIPIPK